MKTVRDVLLSGQEYLAKANQIPSADARRELEDMLATILDCKRLEVYLRFDQPISDSNLLTMRDWLKRRTLHHPLQWLLGGVDFLGSRFPVSEGVFIPRPETEEWVDWVAKLPLELFPEQIAPRRFLEIGVGSGVICCSLLKQWQESSAVGIDCSDTAISTTKSIADQLGITDQLSLQQLRAGKFQLSAESPKFDFIVSNPPYIPLRDRDTLTPEVLFDPAEALFGGEDGLDPYRSFAKRLPEWGRSGTAFTFEIGKDQSNDIQNILSPISRSIFVRNDLAGLPRVVGGILK